MTYTKEDQLLDISYCFLGACLTIITFLTPYVIHATKDKTQASANAKMTVGLTIFAHIGMWSFWAFAYMHQMYPMIRPRITVV